jgi:uncharacterized membrane protein SpoIIM required for sporulation
MKFAEEKEKQWTDLGARLQGLLRRGRRGLRGLDSRSLTELVDDYQALAADLARARSLEAPRPILDRLNRLAVMGHILLYGQVRRTATRSQAGWWTGFARAVRQSLWAVGLAAAVFFGAAAITAFAVQVNPALGFDLVPDEFLDFQPARQDTLHELPSLARPIVASAIISNNIQVTLLAFGLGLTAGVGTTWLLLLNGVHIGAVAAWMMRHGQGRALWGWIMPHGGTELLALCLSGAAGYVLAGAILAPGLTRRATALKHVGGRALIIAFGCMAMLLVAGLIEGFVSPSSIGFSARIVVLFLSLALWAAYFTLAGRQAGLGSGIRED